MKRTWKGYLLVGPLLAGFLLFYVFPFGQVVWDSLSQGTGKSQLFVGLENYTRMFQNQMFLAAFGNTLRFLGIGLPVLLLLAYALALFLKGWAQRFQVLGLSTGCFWLWACPWRIGSNPRRPSG